MQPPETLDLEVRFQPIVSVRTGSAVGAEALLRGRIGGTSFPPRALIRQLHRHDVPVAETVLGRVAHALDEWDDVGATGVWCSVNLDACDLAHGSLDELIADLIGPHRASRIVAEITELRPIDPVLAGPVLQRLRKLGVRIAIDDFGVGESMLPQFELLEPDIVKIDSGFVAGMQQPGADRAMVQVTIALARRAGLTVIAEGVERVGQLSRLSRLDCQLAQGFLFSEAVSATGFAELVRRRHSPAC